MVRWIPFGLLVIAAVCDLRRREIPDAIPLLLLAFGVVLIVSHATLASAGSLVAGLGCGAVIGVVGFARGVLGGADAKLLMALGFLLGWSHFMTYLMLVAVAGGGLAIIALVRGQRDLAYGPAFALGWGAWLWWQ